MTIETTGAEASAVEGIHAASLGIKPDATVVTSDSTTEQQSDADNPDPQSGAEGSDSDAKPEKRKHWAHERIDTLTRQRHEAERQAEYWKAKAAQQVDTSNLGYEEEIVERVSQRQRQEQADTAKTAAESLSVEVFNLRETAARERFTDYDAVTRNPGVPITPVMLDIARDSEVGPDLVYHLGKNIPEAARIASLPPHRQAVELGKLEARLTAPKPVPRQPPPPVDPVSGIAAGGSKSPGEMTFEEYKAWREKT
jgi:hypothetical protein